MLVILLCAPTTHCRRVSTRLQTWLWRASNEICNALMFASRSVANRSMVRDANGFISFSTICIKARSSRIPVRTCKEIRAVPYKILSGFTLGALFKTDGIISIV